MQVVHLSTHESAGGAARAARTLHDALVAAGVDSRMAVRHSTIEDRRVVRLRVSLRSRMLARAIERSPFVRGTGDGHRTCFSFGFAGADVHADPALREADLFHLHWIPGLLDPAGVGALLSLGKPVVWTLHDEWPYTGGCHFTAGCERWQDRCDACPQLRHDRFRLVAARFAAKAREYRRGRIELVTPSEWLARRAAASRLLGGRPVVTIPYAVDLDLFSPHRRAEGRRRLGLGPEEAVLLFNADTTGERRKGLDHLLAAIESLRASPGRFRLVALGRSEGVPLPDGTIRTGRVDDRERVASFTAASDLTVVPSLEDNLPNVILESIACGTPVAAYATGGIPEAIEGSPSPLLVPTGDVAGLGAVLGSVLVRLDGFRELRPSLRAFAERRFAPSLQAKAHVDLYRRLLIPGRASA